MSPTISTLVVYYPKYQTQTMMSLGKKMLVIFAKGPGASTEGLYEST